jgi:biopolymer transport protein ExbB
MSGVAEALTATAVGLLVAIPALVAFNVFKRSVKVATNNAQFLARTLLAHLKSVA